jgi:hypothetical protein
VQWILKLSRKTVISAFLVAALSSSVATAQSTVQVEQHRKGEADASIQRLFEESDEAYLKRNPLEALLRGDLRYADTFWTYLTEAY